MTPDADLIPNPPRPNPGYCVCLRMEVELQAAQNSGRFWIILCYFQYKNVFIK